MLNLSKDSGKSLPRIQSQKRVHTAFQRKENSREVFEKKTQPHNRQLKRAFSTANTCKAVKYETTGLMYSKKIAQLDHQNSQLDRQLKRVQEQIKAAKKSAISDQKKSQVSLKPKSNFITQVTDQTESKISNMTNRNLNNEKVLNSEIKLAQNKLQIMRKKMDEQTEKNKKTRKEVDKVRKEINTLKQLNRNLQSSLMKTNEQYDEYNLLSKKLDEEIAVKNSIMHKTKVLNQHKKAEMIRQYNQILKCLERELAEESNKKGQKSLNSDNEVLYFTQYEHKSTAGTEGKSERNNLINKLSNISLRKSKSNTGTASQMSAIKSKLERYQKQMQQVKNKTGTKNTDQIIKKFDAKYEQNFDFYKYINELYASLEQKQKQKQELISQRQKLIQQISSKPSQIKYEEIQQIYSIIGQVKGEKEKYSKFCQSYSEMIVQLQDIIKQYYSKIYIDDLKPQHMTEDTIVNYLVAISNKCMQLEHKFGYDQSWPNNCVVPQTDLNQMLEFVTKQNNDVTDSKADKLMTRQDFLKARDTVLKKKQTPRRPLSKR